MLHFSVRIFIPTALFAVSLMLQGCVSDYAFIEEPVIQKSIDRVLVLDSESKEYIPVVKIPLIIDNSASMEDEQLLLAQNSRSLADAVRGKNVEFHVLSSSALDAATANEKATHSRQTVFEWFSSDGTKKVSSSAPSASDGANYPSYLRRVKNVLNPSLSGAPIVFRHDMSDSEFTAKREELYRAIVGVETSGSDDEAGLCAIGRALAEDEGAHRIFSPGDKAAFLVISDANDFSLSEKCTHETSKQRFKFSSVKPGVVTSTIEDQVSPEWWAYSGSFRSADTHLAKYTYTNGSTFKVKSAFEQLKVFVTYEDPKFHVFARYERPAYSVVSIYTKADHKLSYTYEYQSTCSGRDSSTVPCTKSTTVSNVAYRPAGSAPASGACSGDVLNHAKGLLAQGQTLKTCHFMNSVSTSSSSQSFAPASYGSPASGSGNLACNASLEGLAKSMVPSGWSYASCAYTYQSNAAVTSGSAFAPSVHGNPASGSGNLTCNASIESLAKSLIPSGAAYAGCYYTYSANRTVLPGTAFDPASHGNPPGGSGNLACNSSLENLAKTLVPSGKSYVSCHYARAAGSKTVNFDPAAHDNPASGPGNLACNASLTNLAKTLVPNGQRYTGCTYTGSLNSASGTLSLSSAPSLSSGASCMDQSGILSQVQAAQPGKTIQSCIYERTAGSVIANCSLNERENLAVNLCGGQSFSSGGVSYANLETYWRGKCSSASTSGSVFLGCSSRKGYRQQVTQPSNVESYSADDQAEKVSVIAQLMEDTSSSVKDFQRAIHARAQKLFGDKGYFVSAIIAHSSAGNCEASPDSVGVGGEEYFQLANQRPDGLKSIHPICSSTYAPALQGINEFIQRTALTGYRVPLSEGEQIRGVNLRRTGQVVSLQEGVDYAVNGPSIDFALDVVKPGDSIVVSAQRKIYVQGDREVAQPKKK